MTNFNTYARPQQSALAGTVSSLFSVAILVMAGVLTFVALLNV
jgi:hypothetical protein